MKRSTLVRLADSSRRDEDTGCVLFSGYLDRQGYGRILHGDEKQLVHRVAHEIYIGPIPDGYQVDHLCGVRHCVNPAHLEAVTPLVNTRRAIHGWARRTHCVNGHAFTDENTRRHVRPNGHRYRICRACDRERAVAARARRAAA